MSAPVKPPILEPGRAYVHITSSVSAEAVVKGMSNNADCRLRYMGPVGELGGEHIFEIQHVESQRGVMERVEPSTLEAIKRLDGVKQVNVMETKLRAKRDDL
ncbi:MAG: hypothetical protein TREMPRED_003429 [Tremellales sp. Tagirdzhanova-0007]|nr:MAG: hypothetical protein TREMPRED_003429 [Tremellales sp. Tagirdzhanova-0007]